MPKFSYEDFKNQDNASRLMVIVMSKMGRPPLTHFNNLSPSQKMKFNKILNQYISDLGEEDWYNTLKTDFDQIVNEDILNEDFDASKLFIQETITDRNVLLSPEQEEWIREETEKTGEVPRY
jgi:hypothetical protein